MSTFILRFKYALGDTVLATALARDVRLAHPGTKVQFDTHWSGVWQNNPHAAASDYTDKNAVVVELSYAKGIAASGRGERVHFLSWLHKDFEGKTGLKVPVTEPKGEIFLTPQEAQPTVSGRYWVVVSGGKLDMTIKHWHHARYQEAVDRLTALGVRFVQCGAVHNNHVHPPMRNALNAVGRTENVRDLFSLIANADGVLCGITGAMHIAAVFDKPCVVVAGGGEEPSWEAYSNAYPGAFGPACAPVKVEHKFLHTVGLLPCCQDRGCRKARVVPIDNDDLVGKGVKRLCLEPVRRPGEQTVPLCMDRITVDHVVEAVMSYYETGMLPPIGTPSGKYAAPEPLQGQPAPLAFVKAPAHPGRDQRPDQVDLPPEVYPKPKDLPASLCDPVLGGRMTVFVLCWGPHPELAKRCVGSILHTMPPKSFDLRVACNECHPDTIAYLRTQPVTRLYVHPENRLKYPVMREMFRDPETPVQTPYLCWFDDDSYVSDPLWLPKLCDTVVANHPHGSRLYGWKHLHDLAGYAKDGHRPDRWFREAPWHRGVDFRSKKFEQPSPNGSVVEFVTGGFWAMATHCITECDIPDARLRHNGGDVTIGEMVRQAGYKIKNFNENKRCVMSSAHPRRGYREDFPWSKPA